jgi:hypothetical protein
MKMIHKILMAVGVAAVVEAVVFGVYLCGGAIGGDGPDATGFVTIFVLHFPGLVLADALRLGGAADTVLIVFIGFLQYLIIALLVAQILSWRKKRIASQALDGTA